MEPKVMDRPQGGASPALGVEAFVKARLGFDGGETYTVWRGAVYGLVPDEPQVHLFDIVGMNVARGFRDDHGHWCMTSRELNYYLDAQTQAVLHSWENPWTGERVPVVHVANDPVEHCLGGSVPTMVAGDRVTFAIDVFPRYPNPLGNDPRFRDYSPNPVYHAAEFFQLTVPLEELQDASRSGVETMTVAWHRIGPWLPWMKMGDREGQLVYSACGQRVGGFEDLPEVLKGEIRDRLPQYRHAPTGTEGRRSDLKTMTSWRYFQRHFDAYLRGDVFPVAEGQGLAA
ncbi:MAG: DUF1838 domain-containing protein [Cyanophyceae cyanobacterium]